MYHSRMIGHQTLSIKLCKGGEQDGRVGGSEANTLQEHFKDTSTSPEIKPGIYSQLASLMAPWVKNLAAMQETQEMWVWSLGQEDPLVEEMSTTSNILA